MSKNNFSDWFILKIFRYSEVGINSVLSSYIYDGFYHDFNEWTLLYKYKRKEYYFLCAGVDKNSNLVNNINNLLQNYGKNVV